MKKVHVLRKEYLVKEIRIQNGIILIKPPELWDQFKTDFPKGNHIRVHPILHWNEIDIWAYIERENIPLIDLYFAKDGKRYRSLGCAPCTGKIDSNATTIDEIIEELKNTKNR